AVYGSGLVELPDLAGILEDIGRALGPWTYLLVGTMAFLEAAAFVGVLVPGETTIVVGGVVAGQGQIDIVVLIAIAWSMAFLGDLTGYLLGRRLGRPFLVRHGPRFRVSNERIEQADEFFASHGGKAIFIGRFVGIVRSLSPFLAGSSRMPLRRFVPYDILGSGLQSTLLCLVGYFFWHSLDRVLDLVKRGAFVLGATLTVLVALVVAVRWLREAENREAVIRWLQQRRRYRLARWALTVIDRAQWPARFLVGRVTPGDLGLELITLLSLASVGGYVFIGYILILDPGSLTPGDQRGYDWSVAIGSGLLEGVAEVMTRLGHLPIVAVVVGIAGGVLIARRQALEGLALWWGLVLTAAAVWVLKGAVWAAEPAAWPAEGAIERTTVPAGADSPSYPSAIAAYAVAWVAIALALRHAVARLAQVAVLLVIANCAAAAAALSVVYLGQDWFSDAAGGLGLGVLAFSLAGTCALGLDWLGRNLRALRRP
ncbi:MAG TPA: VTT domain-containing protein, partial [Solirubrobacterales bacterium]|nr:VTT domain-containing protein [Solirubrobacterales bacterium]